MPAAPAKFKGGMRRPRRSFPRRTVESTTAGRVAERLGNTLVASSTLVPVSRLFEPGYLIEVEVTAVTG